MSVPALYTRTQSIEDVVREVREARAMRSPVKERSAKVESSIHRRGRSASFPIHFNWNEGRVPVEDLDPKESDDIDLRSRYSKTEREDEDHTPLKELFKIDLKHPFHLDIRTDFRIYTLANDADMDIYYRTARVFLQRFHENTDGKLDFDNYLNALRLIALSITIKNVCDNSIWNRDFIESFDLDLTVKKFNKLETAFLEAINFNTLVSPSEMFREWTEKD